MRYKTVTGKPMWSFHSFFGLEFGLGEFGEASPNRRRVVCENHEEGVKAFTIIFL
jgi:hypothetical protein